MNKHFWDEEQDQYLRDNCKGIERKLLLDKFNNYFKLNISFSSLSNRMRKLRIYTGVNSGCFKKGNKPFNAGLKQTEYMTQEQIEKTSKTRFKKGNIPVNIRKVGDERIDKDGYVLVKIKNKKRWQLKHRILYEKYHQIKLNKSDVIIFADGNKYNFDEDNLVKITNDELLRLNHDHLYYKGNKNATKIGVDLVRLNNKVKSLERER